MFALTYPVEVEEAGPADFVATFPDVPEAITGAETREQALVLASEALAVAIEHYLELGRAVPPPAERPDLPQVPLEPAIAARLLLIQAMAHQGLSKVALAARMGVDEKAARRIVAGRNVTLDRTLDALRAVGVHPALAV
jgi:antitoxin HicB